MIKKAKAIKMDTVSSKLIKTAGNLEKAAKIIVVVANVLMVVNEIVNEK